MALADACPPKELDNFAFRERISLSKLRRWVGLPCSCSNFNLPRQASVDFSITAITDMKTKLITIVSIVAVSWLALIFSNTAVAQISGMQPSGGTTKGASIVATPISATEAAKKYPPPKGGNYPMGERDPHKASGVVSSPYPPRRSLTARRFAHGGLVLTHARTKSLEAVGRP
jgi:hypothetical protein